MHVFFILSFLLTFWLFQRLDFKSVINQYEMLLRQTIQIFKEPDEVEGGGKKLLNIFFCQLKLITQLFVKLVLVNLPMVFLFLVLSLLKIITVSDLISWHLLMDFAFAFFLFFIIRKYVGHKV